MMTSEAIKLYHASLDEIREPDIYHGRKNADFGQGFYLTPDIDFAYRWASDDFVVNEYVLDLKGLNVQRFSRTPEWFEYIYHNRRARDTIKADVIIGPVAGDTIYDTLGVISSGYLTAEQALYLLDSGPVYTQAVLKTERAAKQLKWIGAQKITDIAHYRALRKEEEKAFLESLSGKLDEMLTDD